LWTSANLGAADRSAMPRLSAAGIWLAGLVWGGAIVPNARGATVPDVIPAPAHVELREGEFTLHDGMRVQIPVDARAARSTRYFLQLIRETRGVRLVAAKPDSEESRPAAAVLNFQMVPALPDFGKSAAAAEAARGPESYAIEISPQRVTVSATDARGLLYGAVTLWQLCTGNANGSSDVTLPALRLVDGPRFAWRGLLLDSARHFQSSDFIMQLLDWMALHKLNVLQWHLTDDQAWRLEIRKYPRLTSVGAWRVPAGAAAAADIDATTGKPRLYGGFYSQQTVREIVAHATARNITIVPEIDVPGHATAAIVAYPWLGTASPAAVSSDWGVHTNLYNAEPATFAFLQDVLTEVLALFPGRYIHLGGDEAVKDQWLASAQIQQRMRESGVTDVEALQGYFVSRMASFLAARKRVLIGWDEILGSKIPLSAAVMSWRGVQGAVTAAAAGHDVVLSPQPDLYFDNRQGNLPGEPPGRGRIVSLEDVYRFDATPAGLTPQQQRQVLGVQANVWTEHIRTERQLELMTFPRAAALAEVGWSQPTQRSWTSFVQRLPAMLQRYGKLGIQASPDAFAVDIGLQAQDGGRQARVTLNTQAPGADIRYTLDGREPDMSATLYTTPFSTPARGEIRAATWVQNRRPVPPASRALDRRALLMRTSAQLRSCTDKLVLYLEDDAPLRGDRAEFLVDIMNPCWIYPAADLGTVTSLGAAVGQVPFNFQLGQQVHEIALTRHAPAPPQLEVFLDGCGGEKLATLPLPVAQLHTGVTALPATRINQTGVHDLCFRFTRAQLDPMWVLDRVGFYGQR
jgi:hexosaminidase